MAPMTRLGRPHRWQRPDWLQTRTRRDLGSAASRIGRKPESAAISDRQRARIGRKPGPAAIPELASAQKANCWEIESRLTIPAGIP